MLRFGPYRLLYKVSSGGMAEIYRAVSTIDGRTVALKRILPQYNEDQFFIEMLLDEARITSALNHSNIAKLYTFGAVNDEYFIAMEFIDGQDLRALLLRLRDKGEKLPPIIGAYIMEQALIGLDAAHSQCDEEGHPLNIVHRDISPSNLLLSYQGDVKLIDFGIAKDRLSKTRTRGGVIKGKVKYMSPEQTLGMRLDRRSDVFAAGSVLYHAITGLAPFYAPEDPNLMVAIRDVTPDPPSLNAEVDPTFDAIIAKALAKDPAQRFATAKEFANYLQKWRVMHGLYDGQSALAELLNRLFKQDRTESNELLSQSDSSLEEDTAPEAVYTRFVDIDAAPTELSPLFSSSTDWRDE